MLHAMSWHRHSSGFDSEIRSAVLQAWTGDMRRQVDHNPWQQYPGRRVPPASFRERTDRMDGPEERHENETAEACEPGYPAISSTAHGPKGVRPRVYWRRNEESKNPGCARIAFR